VWTYVCNTDNFDFDDEMRAILQHFRESKTSPLGLWVIKARGEAYMQHGLIRSALDAFEWILRLQETHQSGSHVDTLETMGKLDTSLGLLDFNDPAIQLNMSMLNIHKRAPERHPNAQEQKTRGSDQATEETSRCACPRAKVVGRRHARSL